MLTACGGSTLPFGAPTSFCRAGSFRADFYRFSSSVSLTQLSAAFDERRWMMSRG